jgi:hypothetical protein
MIEKNIIKIEGTDKKFSALGGIFIYNKLIETQMLETKLFDILPKNKIEPKTNSYDKFKALCLGFVAGSDCLDDMEKLGDDIGFKEVLGHVNSATTYGDYLRSFSKIDIVNFKHKLIEAAIDIRQKIFPEEKDFILDLDSTSCVQYGKKMEGLSFNYKNDWCLDSIQAYDQFGINYYTDVRKGGTYTSNNAPTIIHEIFKRIPIRLNRFFRADSGFSNVDCYNAIINKEGKFVISMKENVYSPLLEKIDNWKRTDRLKFYDGRSIEVGHTFYWPNRCRQNLRVTVMRALKNDKQRCLFNIDSYDYFACISNIGHDEMSNVKLIKFYRKRGQAENFIKELKYGFDCKHWPCQKLNANKVYAIVSGFAYNFMRYMAYKISSKKVHYSKMIRFKTVFLACQVIKHARYVVFRFNNEVRKEVDSWVKQIQLEFSYGYS